MAWGLFHLSIIQLHMKRQNMKSSVDPACTLFSPSLHPCSGGSWSSSACKAIPTGAHGVSRPEGSVCHMRVCLILWPESPGHENVCPCTLKGDLCFLQLLDLLSKQKEHYLSFPSTSTPKTWTRVHCTVYPWALRPVFTHSAS